MKSKITHFEFVKNIWRISGFPNEHAACTVMQSHTKGYEGRAMSQLGNSPASRDIAYVLHGYTDHEAHKEQGPHILQGGKGIYVYDDTGKEFIEGMAGLWCTSLGYGQERLVEEATEQLRKMA